MESPSSTGFELPPEIAAMIAEGNAARAVGGDAFVEALASERTGDRAGTHPGTSAEVSLLPDVGEVVPVDEVVPLPEFTGTSEDEVIDVDTEPDAPVQTERTAQGRRRRPPAVNGPIRGESEADGGLKPLGHGEVELPTEEQVVRNRAEAERVRRDMAARREAREAEHAPSDFDVLYAAALRSPAPRRD